MVDIVRIGIIIGVVLIIALLVIYFSRGSTKATAPSQPQNQTQSHTQSPAPPPNSLYNQGLTNSSSESNTTINITVPTSTTNKSKGSGLTYCISNHTYVLIYNGNFSEGNYAGWNVSGAGFRPAPVNIYNENENGTYYQNMWSNYNGKYAATTYRTTSLPKPGNISTSFGVVEPYLNFQIVSPKNSQLYVQILQQGMPVLTQYYDTAKGTGINNAEEFADASINMTPFMCETVTIKVVANVYGATSSFQNQFIAVGQFYQSKYSMETPGILVNQT